MVYTIGLRGSCSASHGGDLDPASSKEANKVVSAKRIYTAEHDGLSRQWRGRLWLNPPYGLSSENRSNQALWSESLLERFERGEITQAVLLVNAATDASWFCALWSRPLCFVDHRIRFERPGPQPTHGNVFVYLGARIKRFQKEFAQLGRIVIPSGE